MDTVVTERGVDPGEEYINSFFGELKTDLKFTKVQYEKILPHSAVNVNAEELNFVLDPKEEPFIYLLNNMLMQVSVVITKEDTTVIPDITKVVGPVNNVIGSLFKSCLMTVNDVTVSLQPGTCIKNITDSKCKNKLYCLTTKISLFSILKCLNLIFYST